MNQLKKLFAVAALTACVLPVAAQYPVRTTKGNRPEIG